MHAFKADFELKIIDSQRSASQKLFDLKAIKRLKHVQNNNFCKQQALNETSLSVIKAIATVMALLWFFDVTRVTPDACRTS